MDIHLDPLGGWSGDMFVAAMLDAFPEHWPVLEGAIASLNLGPGSACACVAHRDSALTGRRFLVAAEEKPEAGHAHPHDHDHHHPEEPHGPHRAWAEIRRLIEGSTLGRGVTSHAIGIFSLLAEAEAEVHGVEPDAVMFHEVGAVDSIVDIVAAAALLDAVGAAAWTSAPLPIGAGRVRSAHGILPVPAPATALLLRGLATIDDGIPGERVTPTGAAVARYLLADASPAVPRARRLLRTGTGFGQRRMEGISNCLRVLVFEPMDHPAGPRASGAFGHRELAVIGFEVDDQSAEDLGAGLDHLRTMPGVHDVAQAVMVGKKGRVAAHVQVLAARGLGT